MRSTAKCCLVPPTLDLVDLDVVAGGFAAPEGGMIRERTSDYTWWGMTYQQTIREALDQDGNVVASQVHRPGGVWSDRSTTNADGTTTTTYSTGGRIGGENYGAGFTAELSTNYGSDGAFTGVGAGATVDGHARTGLVDFVARGSLTGTVTLRDDGLAAEGRAAGTVSAVEPITGLGLEARGVAEARGEFTTRGASAEFNASATGAVTRGGEDLSSLQLGQIGGSASADLSDGIKLGGSLRGGAMGHQWEGGGSARFGLDGWAPDGSVDLEGRGSYRFSVDGRYGLSVGVEGSAAYSRSTDGSHEAAADLAGLGSLRGGPVSMEGRIGVEGTAAWDSDGSFSGGDAALNGNGTFSVPHYTSQATGEVNAEFDPDGNLSDWNWGATTGYSVDVLGHTHQEQQTWGSHVETPATEAPADTGAVAPEVSEAPVEESIVAE